jgi:hypothetical protein
VIKTGKIALEEQAVALLRLAQSFFGLTQVDDQSSHLSRLLFGGAPPKSQVHAKEYKKQKSKTGCD